MLRKPADACKCLRSAARPCGGNGFQRKRREERKGRRSRERNVRIANTGSGAPRGGRGLHGIGCRGVFSRNSVTIQCLRPCREGGRRNKAVTGRYRGVTRVVEG